MTHFEYIAIASSLLLSFAVVRLLDTIPHAFAPDRRDWVHCVFLVVGVWSCAQFWWVSWAFAGVADWTFPKFLLYLAAPAVAYSLARTLSSPDPAAVRSFREHFDRSRRRIFALVLVYVLLLGLLTRVFHGIPLIHPLRVYQLPGLLLAAGGVFVADRRYHAAAAVIFVLLLAVGTFGVFAQPGGGLPTTP